MTERQDARWKFTNARVVRVKHLDKVTFATLLVQTGRYSDYLDVVGFSDERHGLDEGKPVTLSGALSKRKNPKSGQYELQFVIEKYEAGVDALSPKPKPKSAPVESSAASSDLDPFDEPNF